MTSKAFILFCLLLFGRLAFCQSIQRDGFVTSANSNGISPSLESSIGELMVNTYSNSTHILSQGFVQNDQLATFSETIQLGESSGIAYPNPVQHTLFLKWTVSKLDEIEIQVLDVLGKIHDIPVVIDSHFDSAQAELNMENLDAGIYFVHIKCAHPQFCQVFKITKV